MQITSQNNFSDIPPSLLNLKDMGSRALPLFMVQSVLTHHGNPLERALKFKKISTVLPEFSKEDATRQLGTIRDLIEWVGERVLNPPQEPEASENLESTEESSGVLSAKRNAVNGAVFALNQWLLADQFFNMQLLLHDEPFKNTPENEMGANGLFTVKDKIEIPSVQAFIQNWLVAHDVLQGHVSGQSLFFEESMKKWTLSEWECWWLGVPLLKVLDSFQAWSAEELSVVPLSILAKKISQEILFGNDSVFDRLCKNDVLLNRMSEEEEIAILKPLNRAHLRRLMQKMPCFLKDRIESCTFPTFNSYFKTFQSILNHGTLVALPWMANDQVRASNQMAKQEFERALSDPSTHSFLMMASNLSDIEDLWKNAESVYGEDFLMLSDAWLHEHGRLCREHETFLVGLNQHKKIEDGGHWMRQCGYMHWTVCLADAFKNASQSLYDSSEAVEGVDWSARLCQDYPMIRSDQPWVSLYMGPGIWHEDYVSKIGIMGFVGPEVVKSFNTLVGVAQVLFPQNFKGRPLLKVSKPITGLLDLKGWWEELGGNIDHFVQFLNGSNFWDQYGLIKKIEKFDKWCGKLSMVNEGLIEANEVIPDLRGRRWLRIWQKSSVAPVADFWKARHVEGVFGGYVTEKEAFMSHDLIDKAILAMKLHQKIDAGSLSLKDLKKAFSEFTQEEKELYVKWIWCVWELKQRDALRVVPFQSGPWSEVGRLMMKWEALVQELKIDPAVFYAEVCYRHEVPSSVLKKWAERAPHWPTQKIQWDVASVMAFMNNHVLNRPEETECSVLAHLYEKTLGFLKVSEDQAIRKSKLFALLKGRMKGVLGELLIEIQNQDVFFKWGPRLDWISQQKKYASLLHLFEPNQSILEVIDDRKRSQVQEKYLGQALTSSESGETSMGINRHSRGRL